MPVNHGVHRAQVEALTGIDPALEARNGMHSPADVALALLQGRDEWDYKRNVNLGTGLGAK
jgi:hypothetical protein